MLEAWQQDQRSVDLANYDRPAAEFPLSNRPTSSPGLHVEHAVFSLGEVGHHRGQVL